MSGLRELYQEVIFDHYRHPRNQGGLPDANHEAHGHNPLCGDRVTIRLCLEGDVVKDVRFEGAGCAIATASASMMTEMLKGKTRAEVEALFARFHEMVTAPPSTPFDDEATLGKLAALAGVREFPARVKCATLAWHTLHAALQGDDATITTE